MANARLYFTPDHAGASNEHVSFDSDPLKGFGPTPQRDVGMSRSMEGPGAFMAMGARWLVTLSQPIMSDRRQAMQLHTVESHLQNGGVVGFSVDHDKSFLAYTTIAPTQGATTLTTGARQGWNTSATLAAGDYVYVLGSLPDARWECKRVSSFSATGSSASIGLDDPIVYDYAGASSVAVFWARYVPYVVQPPELRRRPLVLSRDDRQFVFDFFAQLELDRIALDGGNPGQAAAVMINGSQATMSNTPKSVRERRLTTGTTAGTVGSGGRY